VEGGCTRRLILNPSRETAACAEDRQLVSRIVVQQDTQAFGELVGRHQSHVRNFLRRLTRDTALAEDLAQDTFLHAWNKLHTYAGKGSVVGWLLKVAYTTFLQSKRKSNRYAEILESVKLEHSGDAVSASRAQDEVTDLDRLLAVLGEEERAIMILFYGCGLSHREVSEATGKPLGTVKSLISRARQKIRQRFDIGVEDHA